MILSNLKFKPNFYYFGSKEVVPNLEYFIDYINLTMWKRGWKYSPMKDSGEKTTVKGEAKIFYTSEKCIIRVYVKGKPTPFTKWQLVKEIKIDADYIHFKDRIHALFIEIPISKLRAVSTESKGQPSHQSDYYQVQPRDTLVEIAKRFNKDINQLMSNNDIKDSNKISVGQKIYIGNKVIKKKPVSIELSHKDDFIDTTYKVKSGDTLFSISKQFNIPAMLIAMQNDIPLYDMDKLKVGQVLKIKNQRPSNVVTALKEQNKKFSASHGLAITQYESSQPHAKQIFVTFSGALYFIGAALDIGIAYDDNGDWMLYFSVGTSGEIDPSKMPHLTNDGNIKDATALLRDEKKLKESLKKDVSVSMGSTTLNVKAKHVSDLKGSGLTLTNTLNVGAYSISRANSYATVDDIDAEGNIVEREVNGGGYVSNADFGARKVKKVVEGRPVSISHSVAKSYTIPIFLYDRNERLMKGKGEGIKYVD